MNTIRTTYSDVLKEKKTSRFFFAKPRASQQYSWLFLNEKTDLKYMSANRNQVQLKKEENLKKLQVELYLNAGIVHDFYLLLPGPQKV